MTVSILLISAINIGGEVVIAVLDGVNPIGRDLAEVEKIAFHLFADQNVGSKGFVAQKQSRQAQWKIHGF